MVVSFELTLLLFCLEHERSLDGITLAFLQTGNNLNHAACYATCFNLASAVRPSEPP